MANFTPQQIEEFLQEFFDVVGARQYVGARYVPIFGRAGEDTIEWDNLAPYEPLTVVMHQGVSYVSRRYVPKDIQITDTAYWVETYRFNAQVEQYRQEVLEFSDRIDGAYAAVEALREEASTEYVPFPTETSKYGEVGQVLSTAGMGETEWVDPVIPDAEDVAAAVSDWLDDHPEATTTVTDGSVTDAKLSADGIKNVRPEIHDILFSQIFYSANGNLVPSSLFTANGYFNPSGTWASSTTYKSAFVPIPSAGTYQTRKSNASWGTSRLNIQLANGSKGFARNITATDAGNEIVQFTLTDDDVRNAAYVVLSYRTAETMPMLYRGAYPSRQAFMEPVIQFSDNLCLRKMGDNPPDLNVLKSGWWSNVSASAVGAPSDMIPSTANFLVSFAGAHTATNYRQFIITPSSTEFNLCTRILNPNDPPSNPWVRVFNMAELARLFTNDKPRMGLASLSGNYFDPITCEVHPGEYRNANGTIATSASFEYAFVPLQGSGTYIKYVDSGFGINAGFALYDHDMNFVRTIQATQIGSTRFFSATLSESDIQGCVYTHANGRLNGPLYLAYECDVTGIQNCQLQPANFDHSGAHMYGRTLICDGDSLCDATSDLPTLQDGWWGRTARAFAMTGANVGVNGGTITAGLYMSQNVPRHWVSRSIDSIHTTYGDDVDFLILEGGTNDADIIGSILDPQDMPEDFGTWSETDFSGSYDDTKFCGACDSMFYKAISYWPNAKIGYIIPPQMGTNGGANRRAYFDVAAQIAEKWHVPVLDLWKTSTLDSRLVSCYDPSLTVQGNIDAGKPYQDGQHLTNVGYDHIQEKVVTFVKGL